MKNILLACVAIFLIFAPAPWASPPVPISQERTRGTPSRSTPAPFPSGGMFVDVVLNGSVKAKFLVDTGATDIIISPKLADRLSLNPNTTWFVPIGGVSGTAWAFLSKVRAVTVGDATVNDVDVFVYDTGMEGILGMSFLGEFDFRIDVGKKKLILAERSDISGMYDGRPESWWRSKFRLYRSVIESIQEYRSVARENKNKDVEMRISRSLRHFQSELNALERKASAAAVPREWRK